MNPKIIKLSRLALAVAAAGFSTQSFASGFALIEQGASGQGAAYAGAAAVGEDASTIFFNPAAMTRLSGQQIVVAGHVVAPSSDYTDSGNSTAFDGSTLQGINSDGGSTGFVPNFYWAAALDNGLHVGVGVNVPYGLATEYDDGWYGRYHGLKSEIHTININPAIAWKMTDKVSVGFGLSYQYIDVDLTQNIDSFAACADIVTQGGGSPADCAVAGLNPAFGDATQDSTGKLEGDDSSFGWNIGFLFDITEKGRLGLAYRSAIKHDLEGNASYSLHPVLDAIASGASQPPPAGSGFNILQPTTLNAAAELPETFSISYVYDVDPKWSFLADWTWTGWGSLDTIAVVLAGGVPGNDPTLDLQFANTNRYSLGVHYKPGNNWILRGGLALDEAPVRSDEQRTVRIPDNDRTWLSVGFGYMPSKSWSLDVGYSHLFVSDTGINNITATSSGATLVGTYEASVDILSAGLNFNF
jgi:long-chain fatty acid transport protein